MAKKTYNIELTQEEYDRVRELLGKAKEAPIRWRANIDEDYWNVTTYGNIDCSTEEFDHFDDFCYNSGNYFETQNEAREHRAKLLTIQKYKDLAVKAWESSGIKLDWAGGNQTMYYNFYSHTHTCWKTRDITDWQDQGIIYFPSGASAVGARDEMGDDMEYLLN